MKYCENCGAELEEDAKFCEKCGKKVEEFESTDTKEREDEIITSDSTIEEKTEKNESEKKGKKEKNSLTKKQKIITASVIGIILFLLIGYQTGSMIYSQERQTEEIIEALSSKDPEKLEDITQTDDPNLEINSENLENFTFYLEENPDYLNDMIKELKHYGSFESFSIERKGKKLGLYDAYELVMTPVYGTAYINEEDVSVSLNEEELFVSDEDSSSKKIGPFVPGVLTFKAEGEINEFPLTTSEEVTWLDSTMGNEVYLELTGEHFSVYSDLEEADVYINDKKIGQLENGVGEFGPIQIEEDMELSISQTYGDEEINSEKINLTAGEGYYEFYNLALEVEEENENEGKEEKVSMTVQGFIQNLTEAVNNNNFSAISKYIDSSSDFYKAQKSFVADTYNKGITERLEDFKIIDVSASGETAKVKTSEKFIIIKTDSESQSEYNATYKLEKIDGDYFITDLTIE